jgi:hypothetical protein
LPVSALVAAAELQVIHAIHSSLRTCREQVVFQRDVTLSSGLTHHNGMHHGMSHLVSIDVSQHRIRLIRLKQPRAAAAPDPLPMTPFVSSSRPA